MRLVTLVKNYLLILCILFTAVSCSSTKALEGNWKVVGLEKEGIAQQICKSNIEFSFGENFYEVRGLAGINLFNVYVKDKRKSVETFGMVNTGFRGSPEVMEYEDMFFESFLNSDSYKIKDGVLYFYNHEKKLELKLEKSSE